MKKFLAMAVAASAPAFAAQASAQSWQNINPRQRALDARIDAGPRDRSLSRTQAYRLRAEFQQIAMIERDYRRNGLSQAERRDLDRRFDRLSYRVEAERRDRDNHYG